MPSKFGGPDYLTVKKFKSENILRRLGFFGDLASSSASLVL
jgi:hypothetical protein